MRRRKLSSYTATADLTHSRYVYALDNPRDDTIRRIPLGAFHEPAFNGGFIVFGFLLHTL